MTQPVFVRNAREPFECMFLLACLISGGVGVASWPVSASPNLVLALGPMAYWWYVGLASGSLIGLVSCFLRAPVNIAVERVGILLLTGLCTAYGVALLANAGGTTSGTLTTLAFGGAGAVRAWTITRDLRRIAHWQDGAP